MSYLQKQMNILKYDRRLLEHNLKTGAISEADYQKHLQDLRDQSDNLAVVELVDDKDKEKLNGSGEAPAPAEAETPSAPSDPLGSGY